MEGKFKGSMVKRGLCMKFFHQVANLNRRNNSIESLSVNGTISSYQPAIRERIVQFHYRLFSE